MIGVQDAFEPRWRSLDQKRLKTPDLYETSKNTKILKKKNVQYEGF